MTIASDLRKTARRRVLKAGIIACHNHFVTFNCTVREMSETGARLAVHDAAPIPSDFDLILELDGLRAACQVAWRKQKELGVRFTQPPAQIAPRRAQVVQAVRPETKPTLRRKPTTG